jgi:predicted small lipoprotein YifL
MISRVSFLVPIASVALASCGLKGPLYLPETDRQQQSSPPTEEQKRERTRDSGSQTPAVPTDTNGAPPATSPPGN